MSVEDFVRIDGERQARVGFPEVVYAEGKTIDELRLACRGVLDHDPRLLVTRVSADQAAVLRVDFPSGTWSERARVFHVAAPNPDPATGLVVVAAAGTSDGGVAEEAALTAAACGAGVERRYDVGVAGLHRILSEQPILREADVVVVVAGMDGALPSVVAGLVATPVIAVPTSVGYGASFDGLAPLLAMLNACAPGVSVVNIDNGFGAGYLAALMCRRSDTT
jgi:NCAIR mutase (PurE)-related protein